MPFPHPGQCHTQQGDADATLPVAGCLLLRLQVAAEAAVGPIVVARSLGAGRAPGITARDAHGSAQGRRARVPQAARALLASSCRQRCASPPTHTPTHHTAHHTCCAERISTSSPTPPAALHADLIATAYDQDLTIYDTLGTSSFTPQGCSEAGPSGKASEVQVDVHQPTWCPNGRYLAYSKLREERDRATCWVVVVSGASCAAGLQWHGACCMHECAMCGLHACICASTCGNNGIWVRGLVHSCAHMHHPTRSIHRPPPCPCNLKRATAMQAQP